MSNIQSPKIKSLYGLKLVYQERVKVYLNVWCILKDVPRHEKVKKPAKFKHCCFIQEDFFCFFFLYFLFFIFFVRGEERGGGGLRNKERRGVCSKVFLLVCYC